MEKIRKCISIDEDVHADITKRSLHTAFSLSKWINDRYHSEFMAVSDLNAQIEQKVKEIQQLRDKIQIIFNRNETYSKTLGRPEIRFIRSVPQLLAKGCDLKSITKRFNIAYDRDFDTKGFNTLVRYYGRKEQ